MSRQTYGTALLVGGVTVLIVMTVGSVALAGLPEGGQSTSGATLVGIHGGGFGLHKHGSVTLYNSQGQRVWSFDGADSYFDVTMLPNGTVLAGFMGSNFEQCGEYEPPCSRTGFQIIAPDPQPHRIDQYSFPVRSKQNSETHDVERLPSGNYLLTDMEHERIMIVTPAGNRIWQWKAQSRYNPPADPTTVDWLHINDVDHIGNDRYLVSVRNENELLIIKRGQGVTRVINAEGDPALFSRQHNPQWLGPGAVLVADSGNDRIVELHYNDSTGAWNIAWSVRQANGITFDWPRDADRLPNGNTLITDTVNRRIVEITESGRVVWSRVTQWKPYEADRLPAGETVGGPPYGNDTGRDHQRTAGRNEVPVLTVAYETLRISAPLPYWFSQWHLLMTVIALVATIVGSGLRFTDAE